MTKTACDLVEGLIRNWYCEFEGLDYEHFYPHEVKSSCDNYYVEIYPDNSPVCCRDNFCSAILIEKVVQIANAAGVDFHATYGDGLVFTLH